VNLAALQRLLPVPLRDYILHFEASITQEVRKFAASLPTNCRVLDAGAGEMKYARFFQKQCYYGVDLGIGDATWDYRKLHVVADLTLLPFQSCCFDACLNIVTLEHLQAPHSALQEIARTLKGGGRLLLVLPQEWEIHQPPHDYFRFTRYGVYHLLNMAGFTILDIRPVGGFFRLLARRMLNSLQFFPWYLFPVVALAVTPAALLLPLLDGLDRDRNFTLGYICTAQKCF